jgi:predicted DNA-binding transcriptional regulator YafY
MATTMNESAPEPVNINVSAYRVLYILLMLVRYHRLSLLELNRHLFENPLIGRGYNNETISKYINTLRAGGCRIPRASNRNEYHYELCRNPFPLVLDAEETEVAGKLLAVLSRQPDETLTRDYRDFLEHLSWSVTLPDWSEEEDNPPVLFHRLARRRGLMSLYRQYCRDAFHLCVRYQGDINGETCRERLAPDWHVEPQEVIEREDEVILLALDCASGEPVSLDVERIESVRQLPVKNRRINHSAMTVRFALYGRLAKGYRLYPEEWTTYRSRNEIHVKAKVRDVEALLNRLMKYGSACRLLSPEKLREAMRERITALLACLDEPTSLSS